MNSLDDYASCEVVHLSVQSLTDTQASNTVDTDDENQDILDNSDDDIGCEC